MSDLSMIFDLSKKFALPDTFLNKRLLYCRVDFQFKFFDRLATGKQTILSDDYYVIYLHSFYKQRFTSNNKKD